MARMLPHDGRMIMGGKGSITPFNPNQTSSSAAKQQSTAQPDPMAPAVRKMEQGLDELMMDRQRRHALGMRKAEAYALKYPKAPPPKKEEPEK